MDLEVSYQERILLECECEEFSRLLDVEETFEDKTFGYAVVEKGDK